MPDSQSPSELVCAWIDAYYSHRDQDLLPLAHPQLELRPRVGHGQRLYEGHDGLRRWLDFTRPSRTDIEEYSTVVLRDGRVLAEAEVEGLRLVALFEIRDERIASVTMYISDRDLLQKLGEIDAPLQERHRHRVSAEPLERSGAAPDTTSAA